MKFCQKNQENTYDRISILQKELKNIIYIGSAGGWSKPSTGYTYKNIERKTKLLINFLKMNSDLRSFHKNSGLDTMT